MESIVFSLMRRCACMWLVNEAVRLVQRHNLSSEKNTSSTVGLIHIYLFWTGSVFFYFQEWVHPRWMLKIWKNAFILHSFILLFWMVPFKYLFEKSTRFVLKFEPPSHPSTGITLFIITTLLYSSKAQTNICHEENTCLYQQVKIRVDFTSLRYKKNLQLCSTQTNTY